MPFGRLVSPSLTDLFVSELERMILSGELRPGERLPTEQQLSDTMGVSRAVVYNGVKKLEKLGFLRIAPRKGVYVADYLQEGNLETLQAIMSYSGEYFSPDIVKPIIIFRRTTEGEVVRQAAQRCGEAQIKALAALLTDLEQAEDGAEQTSLMYEFYHQLGIATGNLVYPLLISTFKPIYLSLLGVVLQLTDAKTCLNYLRNIFQSVKDHDENEAHKHAVQFIDYGEKMILDRYMPGEKYRHAE